MTQDQLILDMQKCLQAQDQSVYQHGLSVKEHLFELLNFMRTGEPLNNWRLPDWICKWKSQILQNLLPDSILEEYTAFHDCGKPYCLTTDNEGKRHFPDHAEVSYKTWLAAGGSPQAAKLMKMDMMIHKMKAADIDDFIKNPEAITLLLTGLAEIHSNAKMFGGIESESFKIKWNQINRRGKTICEKMFQERS